MLEAVAKLQIMVMEDQISVKPQHKCSIEEMKNFQDAKKGTGG